MALKDACHTLSKAFYISEDTVLILPMLKESFTQDSKVKDLFRCAPSGSELSLFLSSFLFGLGLEKSR